MKNVFYDSKVSIMFGIASDIGENGRDSFRSLPVLSMQGTNHAVKSNLPPAY